jgi:PUA domain protein
MYARASVRDYFNANLADPTMMLTLQVDKGAIPFVMNGSNIMCPGFTSAGGRIPQEIEAGQPVVRTVSFTPCPGVSRRSQAIMAEGKQHAMALGLMIMSTQQM